MRLNLCFRKALAGIALLCMVLLTVGGARAEEGAIVYDSDRDGFSIFKADKGVQPLVVSEGGQDCLYLKRVSGVTMIVGALSADACAGKVLCVSARVRTRNIPTPSKPPFTRMTIQSFDRTGKWSKNAVNVQFGGIDEWGRLETIGRCVKYVGSVALWVNLSQNDSEVWLKEIKITAYNQMPRENVVYMTDCDQAGVWRLPDGSPAAIKKTSKGGYLVVPSGQVVAATVDLTALRGKVCRLVVDARTPVLDKKKVSKTKDISSLIVKDQNSGARLASIQMFPGPKEWLLRSALFRVPDTAGIAQLTAMQPSTNCSFEMDMIMIQEVEDTEGLVIEGWVLQ